MIAKVGERKDRLDLPIVSGKHLRKISNRTALQSADNAEKIITARKIDSFESLANFTADKEQRYGQLEAAGKKYYERLPWILTVKGNVLVVLFI